MNVIDRPITEEISTIKVSKRDVKPLNIDEKNSLKPRGYDWFPAPYPNICIIAHTGSGKTTVEYNIIWHCMGANTKFILIVSSHDKDPKWIEIIKKLEDEGHQVDVYPSLIDENGTNVLEQFFFEQENNEDELLGSTEQEQKARPLTLQEKMAKTVMEKKGIKLPDKVIKQAVSKEPPKPKPKYLTPEYIIISDDQGAENRNKWMTANVKKSRHWKVMNIISIQDAKDLMRAAINQITYVLLFPDIPEDRLRDTYKQLALKLTWEQFYALYKDATSEPHNFLYVGRKPTEEYRHNFSQRYLI